MFWGVDLNHFSTFAFCLCVGVSSAIQADASSLSYDLIMSASDETAGTPIDETSAYLSPSALIVNETYSVASGGSSANVTMNADLTTGTFKFGSTSAVSGQDPSGTLTGASNATLSWGVSELFTATGDGTLTFTMAIDGILSRTDTLDPALSGTNFANAQVLAWINIVGVGNSLFAYDDVLTSIIANGDNVSIVDTLLSVSVDVMDGDQFYLDLLGSSVTQIVSRQSDPLTAGADFLSTATLGLTTTSGLSLTAGTQGAFTNVAPAVRDDPAVVPVPASMPMLIGAISVLGWARRKRSRPSICIT